MLIPFIKQWDMPELFEQSKRCLANTISFRRKAKGISQEKLALEANVDRTYVSQLERQVANPSLSILCRLATILECDVIDLLSDPSDIK